MAFSLGKTYQPDVLEKQVLEHWRQHQTFRASVDGRPKDRPFVFLEGPPTANGLPHPGHVLTRTLKDAVCRYKTMRGFRVERKAGWDCHGLPVEIEVEKELGLKNKQDIEKYGVAKFNQKCRESVFRYKKDWEWMSERVGFWLDFQNPYVTLENDYIESVWWSLKEAWTHGLLYQGHRVTPHCPRCDTALSSHEVNLGYKEVEEPSIFVKFRVKGKPDEYLLAWTTTPWTLPGNVALAVGKDIEYVRVRPKGPDAPRETYLLAKATLGVLRGEHDVLDTMPGSQLVGTEYEPLFPFLRDHLKTEVAKPGANPLGPKGAERVSRSWRVYSADFVTTEDGTGIVHTAAMYGEDDYVLCTGLELVLYHTVNSDGTFKPFVEAYAGRFVKDADSTIIEDLRAGGLLYRLKVHKHDYPFCWRCSTPLLYYARDSWFIRMSQKREELVANNDRVNWVPDHVKEGRFGEFIRNVRDWALSRDRYWGTPLPIWTCTNCKHRECVGSIQDLLRLADRAGQELVRSERLDLHKPQIDELHLACPKCGKRMDRETSVIDTWYDSGAAPFAQWHYLGEATGDLKDKVSRPVDFVAEGLDQTRGWFYTLLAESTFVFGREAYRNVVVNGLVLDEKGLKMSKSKKNYTDPNLIFQEFGADAMRWYLLSSGSPTADKRFFPAAIKETFTRFFLTLWNTHQFYRGYAELDGWTPGGRIPAPRERPLLDRWLLDRLESVANVATREADAYALHKATNAVEQFVVNDLSNWWLRRSRRRFWEEEGSADKAAAYATLHEALVTVCRLMAPFAPFLAEALYLSLRAEKDAASVHLADYPMATPRTEATALERAMDQIRALTEAARSLRSKAGIKTRIPLSKVHIVRPDAGSREFVQLLEILKDEANVKEALVAKTAAGLEDYEARIQQQVAGRELKTDAKPVLEAARAADPRELGRALVRDGHATLAGRRLEARFFTLTTVAAEGALKADLPGVGTLFLDAHLTPELEAEGWARELIRRIQEMRKEANLDLDDYIETHIRAAETVAGPAQGWSRHIQDETRSKSLRFDGNPPKHSAVKEWDIEGEKVTIGIAKVAP